MRFPGPESPRPGRPNCGAYSAPPLPVRPITGFRGGSPENEIDALVGKVKDADRKKQGH